MQTSTASDFCDCVGEEVGSSGRLVGAVLAWHIRAANPRLALLLRKASPEAARSPGPAGRTAVGRESGFVSFLFDASEAVCGAAMAGVVSAVFRLTHLVQRNEWPGSKCCFTLAESERLGMGTDSVMLGTYLFTGRSPAFGDKGRKKRAGKAEEARGGWSVWQLHAGSRTSSLIFWGLPERLSFLLLMTRKHGGVHLVDSEDHMETALSQAGCVAWAEWERLSAERWTAATCIL